MKKCVSVLLGILFIAVSSMYLAGCGNDDDDDIFFFGGGTASGAKTFSTGPIAATDSNGRISVNGADFRTDDARIIVNGSPGVSQDLKAGQVVTIKGRANGTTGAASDVIFSNMLLGPISGMSGVIATDAVTNADVTVLGQTIRIDRNTIFEPCLNGPASFSTGSVIEVSGLADNEGIIHATFIGSNPTGTDYNIRGVVSAVTGSDFTLTPNTNGAPLTVTLGEGATLPSGLADGQTVNVSIDPAAFDPSSASITAKSVTLETPATPSENDVVSAEGFVTQATGTNAGVNTFAIDSLTVDPGSLEAPPLGSRVAVHGTFSDGVVKADLIRFINPLNVTIGAITSIGTGTGTVSNATGTISVNGVTFDTGSADIFVNGAEAAAEDLKAGKQVIVTSPISSLSTGTTGTAQEIRIVENLTGPVSSVTGTLPSATFTVLGQTITIDADTLFEPAVTDFAVFTTNSVVSVSGVPDGSGGILATLIESNQPGTQYHVLGVVSNSTGTTGNTFTVTPATNGTPLTVTFGPEVTLSPCFADGKLVDVGIDPATYTDITSTAVTAQAVDAVNIPVPVENDLVNVEGVVSDLSGSTFTVNGLEVDTSTAPGGIPAGTTNGVKVRVEGTVSADGTVLADQVQRL